MLMVKTIRKSDLLWSAIFSVIVYRPGTVCEQRRLCSLLFKSKLGKSFEIDQAFLGAKASNKTDFHSDMSDVQPLFRPLPQLTEK